jgi:hypothetical protein
MINRGAKCHECDDRDYMMRSKARRVDQLEAINARWIAVARAVGELTAELKRLNGLTGAVGTLVRVSEIEKRLDAVFEALRTGDLPAIEKALGIGDK